jgi:hypothetical protein
VDVAREPLGLPEDIARHIGVPTKTLAQWRYLGSGPEFIKVGRHVRYRWSDVTAWLAAQSRSTTRLPVGAGRDAR